MTYTEKLKDPRWQKKRLKVLERANWTCEACGRSDKTLHVHHDKYNENPWDTPIKMLHCVCEGCHKFLHENKLKFREWDEFLQIGVDLESMVEALEQTIKEYNKTKNIHLTVSCMECLAVKLAINLSANAGWRIEI